MEINIYTQQEQVQGEVLKMERMVLHLNLLYHALRHHEWKRRNKGKRGQKKRKFSSLRSEGNFVLRKGSDSEDNLVQILNVSLITTPLLIYGCKNERRTHPLFPSLCAIISSKFKSTNKLLPISWPGFSHNLGSSFQPDRSTCDYCTLEFIRR